MIEIGDTVECKPFQGGGWIRAEVVAVTQGPKGPSYGVRTPRGARYDITASRVRVPREDRPSRPAAALRGAPAPGTAEPRVVSTEGRLEAQAKPDGPNRSERYLAFVRTKPCAWCRAPGPSDPHHWGPRGMGQKTDDYRTVPLCRGHHDEFHSHGMIGGSKAGTIDVFLRSQVDLLVEWLKKGDA